MSATRRHVLAAVGTSIAITGCLGGGNGDDPTDEQTPTEASPPTGQPTQDTEEDTPTSTPSAEVRVRTHDEHGDILVDDEGVTLYMFDADTQGEAASACDGDCLSAWPPLTGSSPEAGADVEASLSAFEREDGDTQVAANGWPLYYYRSDSEPGHARGQGLNDVWWVLDPAGNPIRPDEGGADAY